VAGEILIAGPTASGKSELALRLAERLGGVVINADSKQVYRELHVLSARPSTADEARAPHMLYGFVDGREAYSAGRYATDVAEALHEAREKGLRPIIVGGTGLYFKALTEGLSPMPDIPEAIRDHWRARAADAAPGELHAVLAVRDPEMAARLVPSDTQRIVRALEVFEASGQSLAEWQKGARAPILDVAQTIRIVVAPERAELYRRIDARFEAMMEAGALEEVKQLGGQKLDHGLPVMRAHGVRPLLRYLAGELSREEVVAAVQTETRQYAKRQLTWARGNMMSWKWASEQEMESTTGNIMSFIDS
jgi:tRNA dimethylallyltransferase